MNHTGMKEFFYTRLHFGNLFAGNSTYILFVFLYAILNDVFLTYVYSQVISNTKYPFFFTNGTSDEIFSKSEPALPLFVYMTEEFM